MSLNDSSRNGKGQLPIEIEDSTEQGTERVSQEQSAMQEPIPSELMEVEVGPQVTKYATRAGNKAAEGLGKNKLILLGGGLLLAILFFVFTALVGKHPKAGVKPQSAPLGQSQTSNKIGRAHV